MPSCAYCVFLMDFGLLVEVHGSPEIPQKYTGACLSDSLGAEKLQFFFRAGLLVMSNVQPYNGADFPTLLWC